MKRRSTTSIFLPSLLLCAAMAPAAVAAQQTATDL
jgi:hypothetical protein